LINTKIAHPAIPIMMSMYIRGQSSIGGPPLWLDRSNQSGCFGRRTMPDWRSPITIAVAKSTTWAGSRPPRSRSTSAMMEMACGAGRLITAIDLAERLGPRRSQDMTKTPLRCVEQGAVCLPRTAGVRRYRINRQQIETLRFAVVKSFVSKEYCVQNDMSICQLANVTLCINVGTVRQPSPIRNVTPLVSVSFHIYTYAHSGGREITTAPTLLSGETFLLPILKLPLVYGITQSV
jgi:hypothetical protein